MENSKTQSTSPSAIASPSGSSVPLMISPKLMSTTSATPTLPTAQITGTSLNPCPKNTQFITLCNLRISQIGPYVSTAVTLVLVIAVIISLFSLLLGGVRWIIAGGDKGRVTAARSAIFAAIIGLIFVFLAYFILNIVLGMFGLSLAKLTLPSMPLPLPH